MTILLCCLFLLLALLALRRRRLRWTAGFSIAALALLLAVGSGLVPQMLLASTEDRAPLAGVAWGAHNRIVVLGAGTVSASGGETPRVPFFGFSRVATAAQAYFACRARAVDCKVIVSGGDPQHHGATEAAVYGRSLEALQIPATDIILEDRSNNTWQNAQNSTALVAKDSCLVVVASGFQLKRALLYFRHFRPDALGISSDELSVDVSVVPSSMNMMAMDALLHEQVGIARYYIYNALGWNAPKGT